MSRGVTDMKMHFVWMVPDWMKRIRCVCRFKNWVLQNTKHCNYILLKHLQDLTLKETTAHLKAIFGERNSIFISIRYDNVKITRQRKVLLLMLAESIGNANDFC